MRDGKGKNTLLRAQGQTEVRKCALDVLQTLLAEAFDRKEIILALADETANGADGSRIKRFLDTLWIEQGVSRNTLYDRSL